MKLLNFFTVNKREKSKSNFANFFLYASEEEKKRVITDAARRANEDQRLLVENISKFDHKTT